MGGALARLGMSLVAAVGGWSAIGGAIMWVGKAFLFLGRLFLLNPIGFAISAIVAAGWLLYDNWETIKGWFVEFFNWLPNKIREVAGEHRVPIVENPPLARALYATVDIDEEIPVEHYQAVAEVIGYVLRLKGRRA